MTGFDARSEQKRTLTRTLAFGVSVAVLAGLAGLAAERARFGASDEDTYARVEKALRDRFARRADTLQALTSRVLAEAALVETAPRDRIAAGRLFDALDATLASANDGGDGSAGLSVYDSNGRPIAWSGRVSDVNRERIDGQAVQYVAPGAFGPSLVRVEPVMSPGSPGSPASVRLGTIVAEQLLGDPHDEANADRSLFTGSIVPVSLRTSLSPEQPQGDRSFFLRFSGSGLLIEAHVDPRGIAEARQQWRARTRAAVYATLAVTLLFCAASFADAWRRARARRSAVAAAAAILVALAGARLFLHAALADAVPAALAWGLGVLFNALLLLGAVGLAFDAIDRWRVARTGRRPLESAAATRRRAARAFVAGVANVGLLWVSERFLRDVASSADIDLLRFSLHPFDRARLALLFGLLLLHAGVIWGGALVIRLASLGTPAFRARRPRVVDVVAWAAGLAVAVLIARSVTRSAPIPVGPLLAALAATTASAAVLARFHGRLRKASQAARLFSFYTALLVPALATYPSLLAFATEGKEALVAGTFAPQAAGIRDDLQRQLEAALVAIDARPAIDLLLEPSPGAESPGTDQAFALWAATELEQNRLTSAVELYGPGGALVSRFALNLPEYGSTPSRLVSACPAGTDPPRWDVIEEAWNILRANRAVCGPDGQRLGAIVVRVMLDYRTLPFLASGTLNLQPGSGAATAGVEDAPGNDVEFAAYGWSLAPIYMDGSTVWQIPEPVFRRLVASRGPFWASVPRDEDTYRVYFLSDRGGIYALGYPTVTLFGHLINLAELVVLTAALYVLLLLGSALFNVVAASRLATGRALLREIRSSFYRKLFLAFVAVAVVPATILAFATRDRLIRQFTDGVNESAVRTATVAQRLVEDYAALQQRGGRALEGLDDQILMLVERAIGQDVNLFDRATLQATSERDLFASRLFPARTPADVYRRIVLDQMPTFVNVEDIGGVSYLVAAARVRTGDSERIVTIPLTLRQRDLDRQRDDLDRRVWSAFVLFVLLGAGLGYWTAERIADPVNRLSRATRRIARGDLDARIAATSSDELRRLVEDFNSMAADLKRQRLELERTQRLEAWADMARQVAHDIKNPLTPIQLSAEHALRVNRDRGRPLSPVLEECISAILSQVKLLRQISAEFSSFASSPTPRPEPTDVSSLVREVLEPYRAGLADRIAIETSDAPSLPKLMLDRTLFARALTNVIENALHAMPGGGTLTVSTREADGGGGVVTVADTGVGMDQEALSKIFEPYFSTRATGTGLGLTIAKRNVELNGGTIAVDSVRGFGTTVTIRLPA